MTDEIGKYIKELRHTVTMAGMNYEVWWVYKGENTRPYYSDTMNRYNLFFQTSIHAHFVALLVSLYRLYETRSDTYNIPTLLDKLRKANGIPSKTMGELNELYLNSAKPLWIKVNILRNKAFGHRSNAHSVGDVFKEACVSPKELRDLVEVTKDLLNKLSLAWDNSSHAFNLGALEATVKLLNDLRNLKKS